MSDKKITIKITSKLELDWANTAVAETSLTIAYGAFGTTDDIWFNLLETAAISIASSNLNNGPLAGHLLMFECNYPHKSLLLHAQLSQSSEYCSTETQPVENYEQKRDYAKAPLPGVQNM